MVLIPARKEVYQALGINLDSDLRCPGLASCCCFNQSFSVLICNIKHYRSRTALVGVVSSASPACEKPAARKEGILSALLYISCMPATGSSRHVWYRICLSRHNRGFIFCEPQQSACGFILINGRHRLWYRLFLSLSLSNRYSYLWKRSWDAGNVSTQILSRSGRLYIPKWKVGMVS